MSARQSKFTAPTRNSDARTDARVRTRSALPPPHDLPIPPSALRVLGGRRTLLLLCHVLRPAARVPLSVCDRGAAEALVTRAGERKFPGRRRKRDTRTSARLRTAPRNPYARGGSTAPGAVS